MIFIYLTLCLLVALLGFGVLAFGSTRIEYTVFCTRLGFALVILGCSSGMFFAYNLPLP